MPVDKGYSWALWSPDVSLEVLSVETSEILARHHRRVVDEFIESVLGALDLGGPGAERPGGGNSPGG